MYEEYNDKELKALYEDDKIHATSTHDCSNKLLTVYSPMTN